MAGNVGKYVVLTSKCKAVTDGEEDHFVDLVSMEELQAAVHALDEVPVLPTQTDCCEAVGKAVTLIEAWLSSEDDLCKGTTISLDRATVGLLQAAAITLGKLRKVQTPTAAHDNPIIKLCKTYTESVELLLSCINYVELGSDCIARRAADRNGRLLSEFTTAHGQILQVRARWNSTLGMFEIEKSLRPPPPPIDPQASMGFLLPPLRYANLF